jgi:serine/threonine protein kinase
VPDGLPFGPYFIIKRIAVGGMAEVFLARSRAREVAPRLVVVKRMLPILMSDPEVMRMFLDEARIASQLAHPYLIQIFDVGHVDRALYVAMDYVHGVTAHDLIVAAAGKREAVPWPFAVRLASYLCESLQYVHELHGIDGLPLSLVHRDVTPTNVMVTYTGAPKLVDFGIARASQRMSTTQPGTLKGKLLYAAPEQFTHGNVDARTDLYGLGMCLYELLAGHNPFHRNATHRDSINAVVMQPPPPVLSVRRDVPKKLSEIIQSALEKDPARRPQSAQEMRARLEAVLMDARAVVGMPELASWLAKIFPGRAVLAPARDEPNPDAETILAPDGVSAPERKLSTQPLDEAQRSAILAALGEPVPPPALPPQPSPPMLPAARITEQEVPRPPIATSSQEFSLAGVPGGHSHALAQRAWQLRWLIPVAIAVMGLALAMAAAWGVRRHLQQHQSTTLPANP